MHGKELVELLCGMLLGDGSLYLSGGHNGFKKSGYFSIGHSVKQKDYLLWKIDLINQFFTRHNIDKQINLSYYNASCKGRSYPAIRGVMGWKTLLPELWAKVYAKYQGKRKNFEFLLKHVYSSLHLAIWLMDDGNEDRSFTKSKVDNNIRFPRSPRFRLAVYQLSEGEVNLAIRWFETKFNFCPRRSDQRQGPILRFTVRDSEKLFKLIFPYISQLPSMRHKFRWSFEKYCINEERSTSIDLDEDTVQTNIIS